MNSYKPTPDHLAKRQIRVFISSTFRDMQAERELLVKKVFPELRRICEERSVSFTEVDLRWGITKEEAAEGKVLPICLDEINTCRPYFIGILGERYGWIPDTVPPVVIENEPWLQEHVGNRTSVTELEILHGVLRNPKMDCHAFFYFRDPAYIATRPTAEQAEMIERDIPQDIATLGPVEAARRTDERRFKLAALKENIRKSGRPLVAPYKTPEELAAAVEKQFRDLIDKLYPKEEVPDPLDQQAAGHRSHALRKTLAYVDRLSHSQALAAFVAAPSTGKGLVFTGDSGSGKTALLAAFASSSFKTHPSTFLFEHYFGATPDSAGVDGFLRRLLGELKRLAKINDDMPATPEKMREALPLWLAHTSGRPIVLVLDGLNQIQGDEAERRLNWLPRFFPAHIRVVASCLPGPALDVLREHGWSEHMLPLADIDERGQMMDAFLNNYRKALGDTLRNQVLQAPGTANPLFLRTVLEELRLFGNFDKLPDKVAEYLTATTPHDLFRLVIRRWQDDFHAGRNLVNRSLRHLWAVRHGLSENEWLDLLADEHGPMDRQTWRPLLLAMEPHLVQRGSLWAFGHDFLRQAVEDELVPEEDMQKAAHLAVADYFELHPTHREMTLRKAAEWPFQLHASQSWERLKACLTDIPLFLALYNEQSKWELTAYWHPLRAKPLEQDMGTCYSTAYISWNREPAHIADHKVSALFGCFLSDNGLYSAAKPLILRALMLREQMLGPYHYETLTIADRLAGLLARDDNTDTAEELYRQVLKIREQSEHEHPDTLVSRNNLANLLARKGNFAEAERLFHQVLAVQKSTLSEEDPDTLTTINNLASVLLRTGDFARAEPLYRQAIDARRRVLGPEHPNTLASINGLASVLEHMGDRAAAGPLYRQEFEACERILGPEHPDTLTSMNNLGLFLLRNGNPRDAEPLLRRALNTRERVLSDRNPDTLISMDNLAHVLLMNGEYDAAEKLVRRALSASEQAPGPAHPDTLIIVGNLGYILSCKNDHVGAEPLLRRTLLGWLRISFESKRLHPNAQAVTLPYAECLWALGRSIAESKEELNTIMRPFGMYVNQWFTISTIEDGGQK